MKKRLQIRDQKQNMTLTLVMWLVLGAVSMGGMLWMAAHKTVVISARGQEQGEIVPGYRTGESGEVPLPFVWDQTVDRQICIPLETGTKAENVVVENRYMEKELWIYIQTGRKAFYKEQRIVGDLTPVEKGICEARNEGVLLRLTMQDVLEYHSTLEEGVLRIDYAAPKELYDRIVVLDPVGGGSDSSVTASGCREKDIALAVARQTAQLMEDQKVKVYLTRSEDAWVSQEARKMLADWVGADLYLEIGLSADTENAETYGICAEYNDEYYIPEFGNLQWADCVARQVTVAASNRAVGVIPASEEDILWDLTIPAARISLGYVTNDSERQLLEQDGYQKKLAEGIAEAINEVYTNTQ